MTFLPPPLIFKIILSTSYVPTNENFLYVRQAISGVHEMSVLFDGRILKFDDVGGQRPERKKRINCLEVRLIVTIENRD